MHGNNQRNLVLRSFFTLFLVVHGFLLAQNKAIPSDFSNTFYLGTHLYRTPKPDLAELKADMKNLKDHGFNLIKIQTHWAIDEPLEGKYDFSHYEEIIEYADKLGMVIYLGLTLENAPAWLYHEHPEVRMVGKRGIPIIYETPYTMPADGKPGPCFDNPVALEKQRNYITALVSALEKHKNILVWNTWQEIAYWSERLIGESICYCPYTLQHFRDWLKKKHGSLEGLNNAWKTNYGAWKYVDAPRQVGVGSGQDIDWNYFMDNVFVAKILKDRYNTIKSADPIKRPVFAHMSAPTIGSGAEWTYGQCQDFLGSSSYPAWGPFWGWDDDSPNHSPLEKHSSLFAEMWGSLAINFDYIRSANPKGNPIWAAEFQGGPVGTDFRKGRIPTPEDIRRYMLTAVGSGVTAISFWVTRAEIIAQENNGFSLLDSEGETTPRYEEASRVGRALQKYPDIFAKPTKPLANIGIVVNELNHNFTSSYYDMNHHLGYNIRGWYRYLYDLGIPVDFVLAKNINAKTSQQYRALVLPFPIALADSTAIRLEEYIKAGGNLISEAAIGRINEMGLCPRGELSPRMKALFGVKQKEFKMVKEPGNEKRWMTEERTWGEQLEPTVFQGSGPFEGEKIRANFYVETFETEVADPILYYGNEIAGVRRKIGKGNAFLLGTFLGYNATAHRNDHNLDFIESLMNTIGVERENIGKLLVRKRIAKDLEAWLLTNPTRENVSETINIEGFKRATDLLGEPLEVKKGKLTVEVQSLDVKVIILEK